MSIDLKIGAYCNNCPNFEPIADTTCMESFDMSTSLYSTIVSCKNKEKCSGIYNRIWHEMENYLPCKFRSIAEKAYEALLKDDIDEARGYIGQMLDD